MKVFAPLLLALPLAVQAQTLAGSVHQALGRHPALAAARADLDAANQAVNTQASLFKPRLGVSAEIGRSSLQTTAPFPESGSRWPNTLSLSLNQPLYTGGALEAGRDLAGSQAEASRFSGEDLKIRIAVDAIAAHAAVVRDQALLGLRQESLRTLQTMLHDIEKRFQAGEVTRTEVAQAQARVADGEAQAARAKANLAISEGQYVRVTGEAPQDLQSRYPKLPLPATLDDARRRALENPALKSAEAQAQALEAAVRVARSGDRPQISVEARAATQDNTEFGYDRLNAWGVYLKGQMNLYDGGHTGSAAAEAVARADAARWRVADLRESLSQAMTEAWQHWQAAEASLPALQAEVAAAALARDSTRKEVAVGTRTTLDLLDAERELLSAKVDLLLHEQEQSLSAYQVLAVIGDLSVLTNTPESAP
ncbi:MAG TPA: TolC family outer membrane protein [Fluviicoccus sp.]|nr:TolC family outer membrane protein [Fluviicoccus sp.]